MPNFFSDNPDLRNQFKRLDLSDVIAMLEDDFQQVNDFPEAPTDYDSAISLYDSALTLTGDISGNFIAPRAAAVDAQGASYKDGEVIMAAETSENLQQLAAAGLMGIILPRKYGGSNFPATIYMMMIEMVSRADASLMTLFGYQDVGETIAKLAQDSLAKTVLPTYARGELSGAMVLSEPNAGSDLQAVQLKAWQDIGGQWRLRGSKHFISNGGGDLLLVLARSEESTNDMFGLSLFLCRKSEQVKVNRIENKLGLNGSPTCEIYFDDAPADLIGKRRFGLIYVLSTLNQARFSVAAQALGIAEAAYQEALKYARKREQFGKKIFTMAPVADMLIDMRVALESGRTFLYHATQLLDLRNRLEERIRNLKAAGLPYQGEKAKFDLAAKRIDMLSPMVKYRITEAANKICYDALQIHGGMGYMRDLPVERYYRDVRITTIYEGTTQVQVLAAAKSVFADIMADFFAAQAATDWPEELQHLANHLQSQRQFFLQARDLLNSEITPAERDAGSRPLVDMYAGLYLGYLLLAEACLNPEKIPVATRFILAEQASAQAGLALIKNRKFQDLDNIDNIFKQ